MRRRAVAKCSRRYHKGYRAALWPRCYRSSRFSARTSKGQIVEMHLEPGYLKSIQP